MAGPSYKPLAAGISGIPAEIFNTPAIDFTDAEKVQAALRAQELANSANEIKVQEAQRQAETEKQMRDALIAQYGVQSDGTQPEFDPTTALTTAQRIAANSGDLDTMLNIQKTLRENKQANAPLTPEQRQVLSNVMGVDIPDGISPQFANTIVQAQGKRFYGQSLEDNRSRYQDKQSELLPNGWEGNPSPDDSKKFKTLLAGTGNVNAILDSLQSSLAKTGTEAATGADYVLQRQLIGDLAMQLKGPAFGNLGAALSPSEYQLLLSQLPALISTPETSLGKVLVERGLGRDPVEAINALRQKINRTVDIEAPIRNMYRKGATPDVSGIIQRAGVGDGASAPYVPPGRKMLGVDPTTGLAIVSKH